MLQSFLAYLKNDGVLSSWKYILTNIVFAINYAVLGFSEPGSWWLGINLTVMWLHIGLITCANTFYFIINLGFEKIVAAMREKGNLDKFNTSIERTRLVTILASAFTTLMIFKSGHQVAGVIFFLNFLLVVALVSWVREQMREMALDRLRAGL